MQTNNKMREACDKIRIMCDNIITYGDIPYDKMMPLLERIETLCATALAEPPRNCEVGTAEEQLKRFKDFCRIISKDETCDGCHLLPQCSTLEHCTLAWAQMPYPEGGAK